jgi:hypothetical protein
MSLRVSIWRAVGRFELDPTETKLKLSVDLFRTEEEVGILLGYTPPT